MTDMNTAKAPIGKGTGTKAQGQSIFELSSANRRPRRNG